MGRYIIRKVLQAIPVISLIAVISEQRFQLDPDHLVACLDAHPP